MHNGPSQVAEFSEENRVRESTRSLALRNLAPSASHSPFPKPAGINYYRFVNGAQTWKTDWKDYIMGVETWDRCGHEKLVKTLLDDRELTARRCKDVKGKSTSQTTS